MSHDQEKMNGGRESTERPETPHVESLNEVIDDARKAAESYISEKRAEIEDFVAERAQTLQEGLREGVERSLKDLQGSTDRFLRDSEESINRFMHGVRDSTKEVIELSKDRTVTSFTFAFVAGAALGLFLAQGSRKSGAGPARRREDTKLRAAGWGGSR